MTVAEARLPMRADAAHDSLDCGSCHRPHAADIERAAVGACCPVTTTPTAAPIAEPLTTRVWRAESAGEAAPGTGVSCATCHMIKVEHRGGVVTSHNQNDNLRPNEKMVRTVCLDCHGLGFAIDALADPALVAANFDGRPAVHVESVEWAAQRAGVDTRGEGEAP